jgi:hypothetical protein
MVLRAGDGMRLQRLVRPADGNSERDVRNGPGAHTVSDKVEATYRRGGVPDKRRRLMSNWANFAANHVAARSKIIAIRSGIAD